MPPTCPTEGHRAGSGSVPHFSRVHDIMESLATLTHFVDARGYALASFAGTFAEAGCCVLLQSWWNLEDGSPCSQWLQGDAGDSLTW